jgi:hypothetical protein
MVIIFARLNFRQSYFYGVGLFGAPYQAAKSSMENDRRQRAESRRFGQKPYAFSKLP